MKSTARRPLYLHLVTPDERVRYAAAECAPDFDALSRDMRDYPDDYHFCRSKQESMVIAAWAFGACVGLAWLALWIDVGQRIVGLAGKAAGL